ncbi:MAG TPA: xanthine dehydrogenase family protein subunit M, partial [Opitutaceae bacterium]|nr:xanthine dehydrogenase family protein subunit M [Opitutaceae bacterium]
MREAAYARAGTVDAALDLVRRHPGAMFVAGGTCVVDLMREGVFAPEVLIDISPLPLRGIRFEAGHAEVGALVPNSDLAWHPQFREEFPAVSEALLAGASGQIRNMASVGGNLLQRTRCPYYRDLNAACNKRNPGTGCAALEGYNRSHAILGGSESCIATHPSDFNVALRAMDATVLTAGPAGRREIALGDFHRLPGQTPEIETSLGPGELILGIRVPRSAAARHSHYLKVRDRASYEFALASAAVAFDRSSGVCRDVRIALGGVATVPWRARRA